MCRSMLSVSSSAALAGAGRNALGNVRLVAAMLPRARLHFEAIRRSQQDAGSKFGSYSPLLLSKRFQSNGSGPNINTWVNPQAAPKVMDDDDQLSNLLFAGAPCGLVCSSPSVAPMP